MAPPTLNRSVIRELMSALVSMASREMCASLRPISLAGMRNSGTSASASRVTCQDSASMVMITAVALTRLDTTDCRTEVIARWAPTTSVFSRLISEPVWVRVKNASGIFCTWVKTCVRSR